MSTNTSSENALLYTFLTEAEARQNDSALPAHVRADSAQTVDLILFRMELGEISRDQLRQDHEAERSKPRPRTAIPAHWVIDTDHLETDPASEYNCTGYTRGDASRCTVPVKLFDDDGVLYYSGRIAPETLDADADTAFLMLDWAENDSGCTRMDYRDPKDGHWKTL